MNYVEVLSLVFHNRSFLPFFLVEVIHVFLANAFLADILNSFESLILQKILNPWFLYLDGKRFFRQQIL